MNTIRMGLMALLGLFGCGCASSGGRNLSLAPKVEVPRFMGSWYVIASIPIWVEADSYNGVESYRQDQKGKIQTTYTFRDGGFDGAPKAYHPVATVFNKETGSEWRMQFIWPFKSAYLIHYVADDYSSTIVGEAKLKNVWIMARTPQLPPKVYAALVARAAAIGYDTSKLRLVPQKWGTSAPAR